ncbi:GerMN domain-containing protein [Breznakiellaceae bacterium SP9]
MNNAPVLLTACAVLFYYTLVENDDLEEAAQEPAAEERSFFVQRHLGLVCWLAFFCLVAVLFFVNRKAILETLYNTNMLERPSAVTAPPEAPVEYHEYIEEAVVDPHNTEPEQVETADPPVDTPIVEVGQRPDPEQTPPSSPVVEDLRERSLYFIKIDSDDGTILRVKTARKLPTSNSPLLDTLNTLLKGPTHEEKAQGIMSLIPPAVEVDAGHLRVLGQTAYISFNDDFQYNQSGAEGYTAALKQIVWTLTEFPTVRDVQILIEGKRIDYLGEGIWIGSPIGRDSLEY